MTKVLKNETLQKKCISPAFITLLHENSNDYLLTLQVALRIHMQLLGFSLNPLADFKLAITLKRPNHNRQLGYFLPC